MRVTEHKRDCDGRSVEDGLAGRPAAFLEIAGPDDSYSGSTLVLRIALPVPNDARVIQGRILFPERISFVFTGSLASLKRLVRQAATARAFLNCVREDDRFDAEHE